MKKIFIVITSVILILFLVSVYLNSSRDITSNMEALSKDTRPLYDSTMNKQDSIYALINFNFNLVRPIMINSCFDCHSRNSQPPWYSTLPLVSSFINDHMDHARKKLDLTDGFPFHARGEDVHVLEEIREEIEDGNMPIFSYRLLHWGAAVEGARRDSLFSWIDESITMINEINNRAVKTETDEKK